MEAHASGLRRVLLLSFCVVSIWTAYISQGVLQENLLMVAIEGLVIHQLVLQYVNPRIQLLKMNFSIVGSCQLALNITSLQEEIIETYWGKMNKVFTYRAVMMLNRLGRDLRSQIKGHIRLQYESNYTEAAVLQNIPISLQAKISQSLYTSYMQNVPLFKGCSAEFINQIIT